MPSKEPTPKKIFDHPPRSRHQRRIVESRPLADFRHAENRVRERFDLRQMVIGQTRPLVGRDVLLDVATNRDTHHARAGKTEDHSGSIVEKQPYTLVGDGGPIHGVRVLELVGSADREAGPVHGQRGA